MKEDLESLLDKLENLAQKLIVDVGSGKVDIILYRRLSTLLLACAPLLILALEEVVRDAKAKSAGQ